ncbi:MAG: two-component system sensor histidine kinase RppB [Cyanobacteria bacterium P01_A01_bin.123]
MAWDIASTPRNHKTLQNQLFQRSRLRLAVWYAGVMGVILTLLGLGVYRAIAHAHEVTVDRELQSVADAIYDSLEATLSSSAQLDQLPTQLLPDLCLADQSCLAGWEGPTHHLQSQYQQNYYIRIVDPAGGLLAVAGMRPEGLPITSPDPAWQSLKDRDGQVYHQVAIALQTTEQETWAYLMVGRSFQDFDQYLAVVRWSILLGLLLALLLVAAASWWLAALAMRPIYQSYSQIQQFTADAAHELRTPLAATQATVESVLRLPHLSEVDAQETLTVINRQNQRLTTLVSDLLMLSRLDSERPLVRNPCHLGDLLNDIAEEMAAFAISKGITLTVDGQSLPLLRVLGNEEQLYRLVLNLVNNALTYTPAGGQVTLTLKRQQQQALISVCDTGIGIALEHQRKIFDRFYRVDTARSGHTGNSGLGLAIAAAIAQAHNGALTVTSQPGKGSTFTVCLPIS